MAMTFEEKLAAFKAQMKNPAAQAAPAAPVAPPVAAPAAPVAQAAPAAPVAQAAPAVPVATPPGPFERPAAPAAPVAPPVAAAPAPAAPVAAEQAPKRRGRPPGSTNKAKETIDTTAIVAILEKMAEEQAKTNEEIRMTCVAFRASIGFPQ